MKTKQILMAAIAFISLLVISSVSSCGEWEGLPDGYSFDSSGGSKPSKKPTTRGTVYETGTVDLGLSVKWSACNLGASYCYEFGGAYDFGNTYSNCDEQIGGTSYDHAKQELGGSWSTPSKAQWQELYDKCYIEGEESYRGVNGIFVTGPTMNTIFIPYYFRYYYDCDKDYWTSTLDLSSNTGWSVDMRNTSEYYISFSTSNRSSKFRIRPVCK